MTETHSDITPNPTSPEQPENQEPVTPASAAGPVAPQPADNLPEWITRDLAEKPAGATPEKPGAAGWQNQAMDRDNLGRDETIPDWIKNLEIHDANRDTPIPPDTTPEPVDLSWLAELESLAPEATETIETLPSTPQAEAEPAQLPAWLRQPSVQPDERLNHPAVPEQPTPGESFQPKAVEKTVDQPVESPRLLSDEIPTEPLPAAPTGQAAPTVQAAPTGQAALEGQGIINQPGTGGQNEVQTGPLAGITDLLPPEHAVLQLTKPPSYLTKLQVPEVQQGHIRLLEEMVNSEATPASPRRILLVASQPFLRILIAIILLAVLFGSLLTGFPNPQQPAFSSQTRAVYNAIETAPAGTHVLVAIDYEPGFTDEMEAASTALMSQLISKGIHLVLVSTSPTGPMQAKHLMNTIQAYSHSQLPSEAYINLGFIPGGAAGLASFLQSPRELLPLTVEQNLAWDDPAFSSISGTGDFYLIAILTEKPATARDWVEQLQQRPDKPPVLMILSTQAEPFIRPYYEAADQQVQYLLAGLADGVRYENLAGNSSVASSYWKLYGAGVLAAIGLLIFFSVLNIALMIWAQNQARNKNTRNNKVGL